MNARPVEHALTLRRLAGLLAALALAAGALLLVSASVQAAAMRAPARRPRDLPAAAVITVTSFLDAPDDFVTDTVCHEAADGECSLRAAVQTLDHHSGGTIILPSGLYTLTDDSDGDLQLQKDITLQGQGPSYSTIAGNPGWTHRLLRVQDSAQVTLNYLVLKNGNLATGNGGALAVVSGTAQLLNLSLQNNSALAGGAIYNNGFVQLANVQLLLNHAISDGAGIYNAATASSGDNLTLIAVQLIGNDASGDGGGLYNLGQASMYGSSIVANAATNGGGAANEAPGTLYVNASTFGFNQSLGAGDGGGLFNNGLSAVAQMGDSTVVSNTASVHGGGIANIRGQVSLASVTVAENRASTSQPANGAGGGLFNALGTVALTDTLVGQNADLVNHAPDCGGSFTSDGYNLVSDMTGCTLIGLVGHNITDTNPLLGPPIVTGVNQTIVPLLLGSPAVDAGNPGGCYFGASLLVADQRGLPRAADGNGDGVARCDIGAFELQLSQLYLPAVVR